MNHSAYRDLISGQRHGFVADMARAALGAASRVYGAVVNVRNAAFDRRLLRVHRAAVPVVSIGNLSAGGTGKTPMVALVANHYRALGVMPVILSRGYKAAAGADNDEKRVLDQLCPGIVHLQDPRRTRSAEIARRVHGAQVLVLDDGFQHRRLARNLDVVLLDALDPWGCGALLPRGLLRESPRSLRRADLVVLTRVDQCAPSAKTETLERVRRLGADNRLVEVVFAPTCLLNAAGETAPISLLRGTNVAAFCGIGNPEGFRRTLSDAQINVDPNAFQRFPDHHAYTSADLEDLARRAADAHAAAIVTTQKDLVKIPFRALDGRPLWAVAIQARIVEGRALFDAALARAMAAGGSEAPPNAQATNESSGNSTAGR